MWIYWNSVVIGTVYMALGMTMTFARTLPGPPRLWGVRQTFTGDVPPSARASGAATTAAGAGMVAIAFLPGDLTPPAVVVSAVAVAFLGRSVVLHLRAVRLRRAYR